MRWRRLARHVGIAVCLVAGLWLSVHSAWWSIAILHDATGIVRAVVTEALRPAARSPWRPTRDLTRWWGEDSPGPGEHRAECTGDFAGLSCSYHPGGSVWETYSLMSHASSDFLRLPYPRQPDTDDPPRSGRRFLADFHEEIG